MAQQVQVLLIEDLDGSGGDDAVRAGLDGTGYQIGRTGGQAAAGARPGLGAGHR